MNPSDKGEDHPSRQEGKEMEASEQRQMTEDLARVTLRPMDAAWIIERASPEHRATGFARLDLMVNGVLPRLVGDSRLGDGR